MAVKPHALWKLAQTIVRIGSTVMFDLKVYGRENVPDDVSTYTGLP